MAADVASLSGDEVRKFDGVPANEVIEHVLAQHTAVVFACQENPYAYEALSAFIENGFRPCFIDLARRADVQESLTKMVNDVVEPKVFFEGDFIGGVRFGCQGKPGAIEFLRQRRERQSAELQSPNVSEASAASRGAKRALPEEESGPVDLATTVTDPNEIIQRHAVVIFHRPDNPFMHEAREAFSKHGFDAKCVPTPSEGELQRRLDEMCQDAVDPKIFANGVFIGSCKLGVRGGPGALDMLESGDMARLLGPC
eukprot:TRINITY_DN15767_c0_g1_i2.p1 TRINITY_DN15767_c0_g1~~TRINITY_DN15767_c0_g1_i2.p1  ORF type:complete len:255 (-),score=58.33 TRINITY_DN15767_c0_g1_i2:128-892(-)